MVTFKTKMQPQTRAVLFTCFFFFQPVRVHCSQEEISYSQGFVLSGLGVVACSQDVVALKLSGCLQALHLQKTLFIISCISFLKIHCTKTSIFVCSHRSRDDERMSKPASTPAKLAEEIPLPKPKESAVAREEKQLPPLPGQRYNDQPLNWIIVCTCKANYL